MSLLCLFLWLLTALIVVAPHSARPFLLMEPGEIDYYVLTAFFLLSSVFLINYFNKKVIVFSHFIVVLFLRGLKSAAPYAG